MPDTLYDVLWGSVPEFLASVVEPSESEDFERHLRSVVQTLHSVSERLRDYLFSRGTVIAGYVEKRDGVSISLIARSCSGCFTCLGRYPLHFPYIRRTRGDTRFLKNEELVSLLREVMSEGEVEAFLTAGKLFRGINNTLNRLVALSTFLGLVGKEEPAEEILH